MALLTIERVKEHLRLPDPDDTSEDALLSVYMMAVEGHVATYIGAPIPDPPLPQMVAAGLLLVADLYDNRGAKLDAKVALAANPAVDMLLHPLRVNLGI